MRLQRLEAQRQERQKLTTDLGLKLPLTWRPRPDQSSLWNYLCEGGLRGYEIAHRRWGKDDVALHWTAKAAMQRVGNYWHMLPEASQGRKAIWDAINPRTGKKRVDEAFPKAIRARTVDNEMKIELIDGSIWQVLGSDNYNSYVGSPPVGVVFSEWALADPQAWSFVMPILEENNGWALFITTPRGRNHAKRFYDMACTTKGWHAGTHKASQTPVFTAEQLERIKGELVDFYGKDEGEAKYLQEYECSFDAAVPGSYYGVEMNEAEKAGRIGKVPYDPRFPVFAVFDLGHGDSMSIGFVQVVAKEPRFIDYHESSRGSIPGYSKMIREKPYPVAKLILPHDGAAGQLSTGSSYEQQFRQLNHVVNVLPNEDLDAGIQETRTFIKMAWFDKEACARLLDCLRAYHREWDEKNKVFKATPKHDWASHAADMTRYVAKAHNKGLLRADAATPRTDVSLSRDGMSSPI